MPSFKHKQEKQLNTLDANESRLVTKCRWVVEVINSFLKSSFRALDNVNNKSLSHTLDDNRIAAALINKFFKKLFSDNDDIEIAKSMKSKLSKENTLKDFVIENRLNRKSLYHTMNANSITDFPVLTEEIIIRNITYGTFQLRQSKSYIDAYLKNGSFEIRLNKNTAFIKGFIYFYSILKFKKRLKLIFHNKKVSKFCTHRFTLVMNTLLNIKRTSNI